MAVEFELRGEGLVVANLLSVQAIDKGFFGSEYEGRKTQLSLMPEEGLYLMDVRGAVCRRQSDGHELSFNTVASKFQGKKFLARYYCYRDWRDRGIIARPMSEAHGNYGRSPVLKYPSQDYAPPKVRSKGLYFYDDLMSVIDDNAAGEALYENGWYGQYGTYKAKKHGQYLKLDAYESLFLMKHSGYALNIKEERLIKEAKMRRADFLALYDVYEDWRLRGFVLKTGFKFGTHFRLYFPGANPNLANDEWMHSKHVIHVFPRESKMLISEWARAIRVAHGVKKTFILAIPGIKKPEDAGVELDFLLYHRKKEGIENPRHDKPKFVMLALSEEEEIGGAELAGAIEQAKQLGLDLILSICDRETSVTHYRVKRIELPKSKYEYYEIEWVQP
ncbi:tRNA-intron lyase [Candidatus Micrarchaeota archaeon]|nr:tRNA-intron lyase [Candidatus Micrarchaeota archaeon]MBI5176549.1 tRNA-intron lyase [Candidatus Micrarchaeota archaeon]